MQNRGDSKSVDKSRSTVECRKELPVNVGFRSEPATSDVMKQHLNI